MENNELDRVQTYISSMSQQEKDAFRFGLTYMVSEVCAYMHQMIDQDKEITHDLLTSMEHHYLRDLNPGVFDETLKTILDKR